MNHPFSKQSSLFESDQVQRQRRMYEAVLSSTPDFVYIFDLDHRFIYANKALLEAWGRAWDEAIGKNCLELGYEPWHAEMHDREIDQVIAEKKTVRGEAPFKGSLGKRIYDYIFVPVFNGDGHVEAVAGTTRDVTDLKDVQRTLQANLKAMRFLREFSNTLVSRTEIQGLYDEINSTVRKLVRAEAGTIQILDAKTQNLVLVSTYGLPPDSAERFGKVSASLSTPLGMALASGKRIFADFNDPHVEDPKGDLRWHVEAGYLSAQSTPLVTRYGKGIGMISTHWKKHYRPTKRELYFLDLLARQAADLIEQKQSEHAVHHLAAIIESSDDAIISKDLKGTIMTWNQGAERIFGYNSEEVVGKSITLLIPKDRQNEEPAILQRIVQGERIDHYDTIRQHKDGTLIDVSLTISPIRDAQGVIGASKIARDITERKKAEEQLVKLSADLERRVIERTKALEDQTTRLRELAVELTQVEQRERRRLAEVLHDHLQQYLVAAKIRIELCERKMGGSAVGLQDARFHIDSAIDASRQLTAELRPPVLYEGGLNAGLRHLRQKMELQHNIRVHLSFSQGAEPGSDLIKAMLYQCVQELLFNTVKYAGVVECAVIVNRLENGLIQIIVEDKGTGFDVSRVGASDKGGFGLFSIRERIKALGGDFLISSVPGQGSSFTLNVPDKVETAGAPEAVSLPADNYGSIGMSAREGIVVMVADDHAIIRQSIASLLILQPFIKEVVEARNGEEAIRKAVTANPDIILMDINMPVMNGIEATQILSHRNFRSKVIGLSVQGESEMGETMQDAGAVAYFNKGDDTNRLIDTIKKFAYQVN